MHFFCSCFSAIVSFRYVFVFVIFFVFVLWVTNIIYQNLMLLIFRCQKASLLCKRNFFYWWETNAMKFWILKQKYFMKVFHIWKTLNKSTRFEINPKSVYTSRNEGFHEKSVSTSGKKLLPLAGISAKIKKWFQQIGIMFFFKNWPTLNFKNGIHEQKKWYPPTEKSSQ